MHVNILGTRGIPAKHGGFETFVGKLAPYLVKKGHTVTVYCQSDEAVENGTEDYWNRINRVHYFPKYTGALGTIEFDYFTVKHAAKRSGVDLVLGYNTAVFNIINRLCGKPVVMNMDGIEWKRGKWGLLAKAWFFTNEVIGSNLANLAIADHPSISKHIEKRCLKKTLMIPYGSDTISHADENVLAQFDLKAGQYFISIARIEVENSILEIIEAFSKVPAPYELVVLGKFDENNAYHEKIKSAASCNVKFLGAIYDETIVQALRFFCTAYVHGHTVGGTNPSLVEALGASNVIIAHDNEFNRWVASDRQLFFSGVQDLANIYLRVINDKELLGFCKEAAKKQHREKFQWDDILAMYERALLDMDC